MLLLALLLATGFRERPAPEAASEPAAPPGQVSRDCVVRLKGQEAAALFLRDIPADRWGDPVRGTVSTSSEPYVLWLFDAECRPHRAVEVPLRTTRTFTAQVGQVWYYAEASAKQPGDGCACRVFGLSDTEQEFSDTGRLSYRSEQTRTRSTARAAVRRRESHLEVTLRLGQCVGLGLRPTERTTTPTSRSSATNP
ncbi:hypothetical protein GA0070612_3034 [Micromonospora chokoriensis]|uniref:Uncharacterized protein n=1 Tax=Micromonospora chokoriensis TaxID=356851 RepID=A0A1C4WZ30_9ACTN|nr:hypothetical protein GA0070612_3034 [Micromonospora chokoriensis]